MKRNTKKTLLIGSTSLLAVVLGVTVVSHSAANGGLFAYRAKAANYDSLSVSFDANSEVLSGSIQSTSCLLGSRLQVSGIRVKASIFNSSVPMSEGVISRFNGDSASVDFFVGDSNESPATNFQSLTSISFGYKEGTTSGKFKVMWSNDNSYWNIISVDSGIASQSLPLGAHYVRVVNDSGYAQFTSFTLNYSCSDTPVSHVHEIEYFGFDEQELMGIDLDSLEYSAEAGQHVVIEPVYLPGFAFYYAEDLLENITDFTVKEGGVIEFTMPDDDVSIEIAVENLPIELESIEVTGNTKTSFTVGDEFDFDGTVIATYTDLSEFDVTDDVDFSGYDMDEAGEQTVTVSYTDGGITKTTTYTITVGDAEISLNGTYDYFSRTTGTSSYTAQFIVFNSDKTGYWELDRNGRKYDSNGNFIVPAEYMDFESKVYFTYAVTNNGTGLSVELTLTSYDIYLDKAKGWSGGSYDRSFPGFTVGTKNSTLSMDSDKTSFTVSVYEYSSGYREYSVFTFKLRTA